MESHVERLLSSRERTQRFTGIKLARLRGDGDHCDGIRRLYADTEEDVYIRLEAASYLGSTCGEPADELFSWFLTSADPQIRLEAVIALGEAATGDAVNLLCNILDSHDRPYFMRVRRRGV